MFGEEARRIDWRRSARDNHLYVREREWEAAHDYHLWMDVSPSMAFASSLAQDDTPMLPVITHALDTLAASGWVPDIVVLLQPTSPLRRPEHVRAAVDQLRQTGADSVVTVVELARHLSPDYVMRVEDGRLRPFLPEGARVTRRQDARPAFSREGTVYACWRSTIERYGSIYGDEGTPRSRRGGQGARCPGARGLLGTVECAFPIGVAGQRTSLGLERHPGQ